MALYFTSPADNPACGYGRVATKLREALLKSDIPTTDKPQRSDVQIWYGQPFNDPDILAMRQRQCDRFFIYSMFESTVIPDGWVEEINKHDALLTPSRWCGRWFAECGVTVPWHLLHHGVDPAEFPFLERPGDRKYFTFLWQGVNFRDRKGCEIVRRAFYKLRLKHTRLIVKAVPVKSPRLYMERPGEKEIWDWYSQKQMLSLLQEADMSLNPTSGEGFGLCVKPGTKIITERGMMNIEDIRTGERVLASNGLFCRVLARSKRNYAGELVGIKTTGDTHEVFVTPEHQILVFRNVRNLYPTRKEKKLEWAKAEDLTLNDLTVLPVLKQPYEKIETIDLAMETDYKFEYDDNHIWHKFGFSPKRAISYLYLVKKTGFSKRQIEKVVQRTMRNRAKSEMIMAAITRLGWEKAEPNKIKRFWNITQELAYVIGLYVAQGSYTDGAVEICLNKNKFDIYENKVRNYLKPYGLLTSEHFDNNKRRLFISNKIFGSLLLKWCGKHANHKDVPYWIWGSTNEIKIAFLTGLFDGDGYFAKNKSYELATVSANLAYKSAMLLMQLGIIPAIHFLSIPETKFNNAKLYEICVSGKQLKGKVFLGRKFEGNGKPRQRAWIDSNFKFTRIKSLSRSYYKGEVYDLQVEGDPSFVCHSITVHNCPLEHAATGLAVAATDFSGCREYLEDLKPNMIGIKWRPKPSYFNSLGGDYGFDAAPDFDHLCSIMDWASKNRDEVRAIGQRLAQAVHERWTWQRPVQQLREILKVYHAL